MRGGDAAGAESGRSKKKQHVLVGTCKHRRAHQREPRVFRRRIYEVEHKKATQSIRCGGQWLLLTPSPASRSPNPQFTSEFPRGEQDRTHACKIEEEL